jgi:hypothetical protein
MVQKVCQQLASSSTVPAGKAVCHEATANQESSNLVYPAQPIGAQG